MIFSDFTMAVKAGQLADVNIITHSGLNRYAVKVRMTGSLREELLEQDSGQPHFWASVRVAREQVRKLGYRGAVELRVTVPQDEIIGRI